MYTLVMPNENMYTFVLKSIKSIRSIREDERYIIYVNEIKLDFGYEEEKRDRVFNDLSRELLNLHAYNSIFR